MGLTGLDEAGFGQTTGTTPLPPAPVVRCGPSDVLPNQRILKICGFVTNHRKIYTGKGVFAIIKPTSHTKHKMKYNQLI